MKRYFRFFLILFAVLCFSLAGQSSFGPVRAAEPYTIVFKNIDVPKVTEVQAKLRRTTNAGYQPLEEKGARGPELILPGGSYTLTIQPNPYSTIAANRVEITVGGYMPKGGQLEFQIPRAHQFFDMPTRSINIEIFKSGGKIALRAY